MIPVPDSGNPRRGGLRAGLGHPAGRRPDQEPLRRAHVHPARPGAAQARPAAEVQPAAGGRRGQAAGGRGRLDRARQHHAPDRRRCCATRARPEVHMRISAPPIQHPCHYGIDMSTREEMVAHGRTVEEIAEELGCDSLAYLSLEGVYEAIALRRATRTATPASPASTRSTAPTAGQRQVRARGRTSAGSRLGRFSEAPQPEAHRLRDTARAMSQENVEAFKRGLEAGNRGDVETLLEVLDPEVAWHSALHALLGGEATVYRGHDGVREMLRDLNEAFGEIQHRDLGDPGSGRPTRRDRPQPRAWQGKRGRCRDALRVRDRVQERQGDFDSGLPRPQGGPRSRRAG